MDGAVVGAFDGFFLAGEDRAGEVGGGAHGREAGEGDGAAGANGGEGEFLNGGEEVGVGGECVSRAELAGERWLRGVFVDGVDRLRAAELRALEDAEADA